MERFLARLTKWITDAMFYTGIVVLVMVPWIIHRIKRYSVYINDHPTQIIVIMMISGVLALIIVWELKSMLKTLLTAEPFTYKNAGSMNRIGIACFLLAVTFIIKCLFWLTLATGLIVFIFLLLGLFCFVLKGVFLQAVRYKEENDLTV